MIHPRPLHARRLQRGEHGDDILAIYSSWSPPFVFDVRRQQDSKAGREIMHVGAAVFVQTEAFTDLRGKSVGIAPDGERHR